jgi:hypothetical protein
LPTLFRDDANLLERPSALANPLERPLVSLTKSTTIRGFPAT